MIFGDRGGALPGSDVTAVSPGFTWGKSGNITSGTYLLNDTVPSNLTGRLVPVNDGLITEVFVAVQNATTCVIAIEKRSGASFIELLTLTITASRTATQSYAVAVARDDEIACRVKSGSCKNPVVGLIIQGDTT